MIRRSPRSTLFPYTTLFLSAAAGVAAASAVQDVDVVVTMLTDPAALAAVSEGEGGFAPALYPGQTLVEMSTVGPAALARLRGALPEGVGAVDAPVLGSLDEAGRGGLVIFVAGAAEDVDRVEPILSELGTPLRVGAPGSGAAAKLVANSTLFGVLAALGESLALADGLGLDRAAAFEVLAHTPLAAQAERRREAVEAGSYPKRFALSLARKDAALVVDAAMAAGVDLRVAPAALAWLADAERAGAGDSDYTAVLETIVRER